MGIFTRYLGTSQEGRSETNKYFAVFDTEDVKDVAIVRQGKEGNISYVCGCCVIEKYRAAMPILEQLGRYPRQVEANKGGNIEQFIQAEKVKAEPLSPYYQKVSEYEHHALNSQHFRRQPEDLRQKVMSLREEIAEIEAKIAETEAKIPEAEAFILEHEQILAEGLPEVPMVEVVRLETLVVEGEEMQKILFPEMVSAADTHD